jgi:hypothetical protein
LKLPGNLLVARLGEASLELGDVDMFAPRLFALARGLGGLQGRGGGRFGHGGLSLYVKVNVEETSMAVETEFLRMARHVMAVRNFLVPLTAPF